jgi:hypothetical protein
VDTPKGIHLACSGVCGSAGIAFALPAIEMVRSTVIRSSAEGRVGEREDTPMPEKVEVPGGNEQWSISKAIALHGNNDLDDVVLVQTMLKIFMTSPAIVDDLPASERAEIDRIFTSTVRHGGKFADGIYGSNTRAAVGILERRIGSPVKDGIIRPIFEVDRTGRMSGARGTKMRELNEIWDATAITESAGSKRESGRKLLPPNVFTALYPDG